MTGPGTTRLIERHDFQPVGAIRVVDLLVREQRTRGPVPPAMEPVDLTIVGRIVDGSLRPFDLPLRLRARRTPGNFLVFNGVVRQRGTESIPFTLAPGTYRLRVHGDFYQTAEIDIAWPLPTGALTEILLKPGSAYPLPDLGSLQNGPGLTVLRGSLYDVSGNGIEGAKVSLVGTGVANPLSEYVADRRGDWLLVLPNMVLLSGAPRVRRADGKVPVAVRIAYSSTDTQDIDDWLVDPGAENRLRQTALQGRVLSSAGLPIPGSQVAVSGSSENSMVRPNGRWFFYFRPRQAPTANVTVTATAPDGRSAQQSVAIQQDKMVDVPIFQLS